MDRTSLLHKLHASSRSKQSPEALEQKQQERANAQKQKKTICSDPYKPAVRAVCESAMSAMLAADERIIEAIDALDELAVIEDTDRDLAMAEASLTSAMKQLKEVRNKIASDGEILKKQKLRVGDLVEYHTSALSFMESTATVVMQNVKLTREEIDNYKAQQILHSRCGILVCENWSVDSGVSSDITAASKEYFLHEEGGIDVQWKVKFDNMDGEEAAAGKGGKKEGFGAATKVVGGIVQSVSAAKDNKLVGAVGSTVAQAVNVLGKSSTTTHLTNTWTNLVGATTRRFVAASSASNAATSSNAAASVITAKAVPGGKAGGGPAALTSLPKYQPVTEDEKAHFQTEAQVFQTRKKNESAKEAQEIELAAREMSRLSSMMNEKLMEQGESLMAVHHDTEASAANLDKATQELRKPLQSSWNSTRTLILVLWMGIFTILWSNHIVR